MDFGIKKTEEYDCNTKINDRICKVFRIVLLIGMWVILGSIILLIPVGVIFLLLTILHYIWLHVFVTVFGLPVLSYWQLFLIMLFVSIIFGGISFSCKN